MPPRVSKESKIALLKLIQTKKWVLFGKMSSDLDHKDKNFAWTEVLLKAKSLKIVASHRDYSFVRDKVWGVWKSRALDKQEKNKKLSEKGEGRGKCLNEIDNLILDIVGPTLEGVSLHENGKDVILQDPLEMEVLSDVEDELVELETKAVPAVSEPNSFMKRPHPEQYDIDELELKRKNLEITRLEVQIYKDRLECLRLERALNLPTSEFTSALL